MPFVVKDILQHKRNERQIREVHEREYSKYITNLRQQIYTSNMSYLPMEHIREIERSRVRNSLDKQNRYERIQRENDLLAERLFQPNKRAMIDDKNEKYQQSLDTFSSKRLQQRLNDYKRINNENHILTKRINNVHGQLINKEQCDHNWQRHISVMKKTCDYPENIDRFVSNINTNEGQHRCKWNRRLNSIQCRNFS